MYGGFLAEQGGALEIFEHPAHPCTAGLLASIPDTATAPDAPGQPGPLARARHPDGSRGQALAARHVICRDY